VGNDSGGAYSQIVAAHHPERLASLVLNSCETPDCAWPPAPGGFGVLKATAIHPLTYRALYQVLRIPRTWRWRNTYGWLAARPIDAPVMWSYLRPVDRLRRKARHDPPADPPAGVRRRSGANDQPARRPRRAPGVRTHRRRTTTIDGMVISARGIDEIADRWRLMCRFMTARNTRRRDRPGPSPR
jgi:pimeloyl-ACP methyl ester carboxylesterase